MPARSCICRLAQLPGRDPFPPPRPGSFDVRACRAGNIARGMTAIDTQTASLWLRRSCRRYAEAAIIMLDDSESAFEFVGAAVPQLPGPSAACSSPKGWVTALIMVLFRSGIFEN